MYRTIAFVAALLSASAAYAQTAVGLPIGYVMGSAKGDAIYVLNADGTGETKVYQAPRQGRVGSRIDDLSLRPGGGEVAFVLDGGQLWVQKFGSTGQADGDAFEVAVPGDCFLGGPDYRSDGDLYVSDSCLNVWLVDTDGRTASLVFTGANISGMAAVGTSLLYSEGGSVDSNGVVTGNLKLRTAAGSTTTIVETLQYILPLYVDAVGNDGVLSGPSSFRTVDLTTGAVDAGCTQGGMVKYSPDGSEMVYEFRNTLFVLNSDCSGAPFRLARGAKAVAWRSN